MASPEIKVPMTAECWQFLPGKVEFLEYKSVPAMKILTNNDQAVVKDLNFTSGTIEYDIEPGESFFTGIYFRRQDTAESEYFYVRVPHAVVPNARDGVQYAPIIKGVNMWNMLDYYQGPVSFHKDQWNHIKLVISGSELLVYVNDLTRPALEIPQLEGNTLQGGLAFDGKAYIANVVVRPGVVEGLSSTAGFDPTHQDPRYLRDWMVSQPAPLPKGRELSADDLPTPQTAWEKIEAERRGLVDLTRKYGLERRQRRVVWLKIRLKTTEEQRRHVDLGFMNEAWVYVNGKLDFGVSNDFYGWGIIARLDTMEGIEVLTD